MKEVIKDKKRNTNIEKYAINELIKRTDGFIDPSLIKERITKSLYNGVYLVSSEEIIKLNDSKHTKGMYVDDLGLILIDEQWFNRVNDVAVHEIVHAYLNSESKIEILINDKKIGYGMGLEEGAASLVQKVGSISNIDDCQVDSYRYQSHLFKQLNVLYQYSNSKKYKNLLQQLLAEPNQFLSCVFNIYNDILSNTSIERKEAIELSYKCACAIVSATDTMLEKTDMDYNLIFNIITNINAIYLSLADKSIRDEASNHPLFPSIKDSYISKEERLLSRLFGLEILDGYFNRQKHLLDTLLTMYIYEMDQLEIDTVDYGVSKIKLK